METYILIGLCAVAVILLIILLVRSFKSSDGNGERDMLMRKEISDSVQTNVRNLGDMISQNQRSASASTLDQLKLLEEKLENMRRTIDENLKSIREDNTKELDKIRGTVDEKLQKTLDDKLANSFKQVTEQLEKVYKGLGEMQSMASNVVDLKKVLSGVKTRGILGEIQLGAILSEILAPEQYEYNVAVVPGSKNVVEYAVKLPGESGGSVWLPIDSKFPGETYSALVDARETCDRDRINLAVKDLITTLKSEAKDIKTKYIQPPHTTNFGIMFLPFEGLYAEAVEQGLVEILQKEYNVNIAGPSTMAALLNSLQMGFRTLAIQKRSAEVWQVLGAVKTEFEKFADVLEKAKKNLGAAQENIENLLTTRTNVINRKLRNVEKLDDGITAALPEVEVGSDE